MCLHPPSALRSRGAGTPAGLHCWLPPPLPVLACSQGSGALVSTAGPLLIGLHGQQHSWCLLPRPLPEPACSWEGGTLPAGLQGGCEVAHMGWQLGPCIRSYERSRQHCRFRMWCLSSNHDLESCRQSQAHLHKQNQACDAQCRVQPLKQHSTKAAECQGSPTCRL